MRKNQGNIANMLICLGGGGEGEDNVPVKTGVLVLLERGWNQNGTQDREWKHVDAWKPCNSAWGFPVPEPNTSQTDGGIKSRRETHGIQGTEKDLGLDNG